MTDMTKQEWSLLGKFYKDRTKYKDVGGRFSSLISKIEHANDGRTFAEKSYMYRNGIASVPVCSCGEKVKFQAALYKWSKTCGQSCYLKNREPSKKQVVVDGVVYESLTSAASAYKTGSFMNDLYDASKPGVRYLQSHDKQCRDNLGDVPLLLDKSWLLEQKNARVSIKQLSTILGVSREKVTWAFLFHGICRDYQQLSDETYAHLSNKDQFTKDFYLYGSDHLASIYRCSPTTILSTAKEYGCKISRVTSAIERHLKDYVESLGFKVSQSDRSIGIELDLYVPSKNVAIELDGLFWHSEWDTRTVNPNKHKSKYDKCKEHGITLLRFTDHETTNKLDLVKSMIAAKLGISNRVYARNCEVGEVTSSQAKSFMESNHISGYANASVKLGLFHNGSLVMVMTFGKPRFSKGYDWEVIRMASLSGNTVVGGASKILTYFRKTNTGSIMSYSDNRTGNGNSYARMGFTFEKETGPGYFYSKNGLIYSRYSFQKNNIAKICEHYDPRKTEFENAIVNGYGRYWDCGNKVWVLK